jgi:AraC-like DNA-binding protein
MKPVPQQFTPLPPGTVLSPMTAPETLKAPPSAPASDSAADVPQHRRGRQPHKPNQANRTSQSLGMGPNQTRDRFETINAFVDITMRGLSGRGALAWLVLWRDTKPNGLARTGVTDLARRMGCSPATAKRALAELRSRNLIWVVDQGRLGRGPSSYRLVGATGHVTEDHRVTPDS